MDCRQHEVLVLFYVANQLLIFVEPRCPRASDLKLLSLFECFPKTWQSNYAVCITKDMHHSVTEEIEDIINPYGALNVRLIKLENILVDILPLSSFFIHVEWATEFGAVDPLKQILPILLYFFTLTESQIVCLIYEEVLEHIFWKPSFAFTSLLPLKREVRGSKNIINTCVLKLLDQFVV